MVQLKEGELLERLLPADWGLPRTALTAYRKAHLAKPEDWRYERQVILSASGAAKMRQHFGLDDAPVEEPVIKEGFVVRWDWRNSRMVEVRDDDEGKYIVWVNNAMKWRPDRQSNFLRIKFHRDGDQWRQTGRAPRYPGIW